MDIQVVSNLSLLEKNPSIHLCKGLLVNMTSHFSGVNAQKCNCSVVWELYIQFYLKKKTTKLFSRVAEPSYILIGNVYKFQLLYILLVTNILKRYYFIHSDRFAMLSHHGFNLHSQKFCGNVFCSLQSETLLNYCQFHSLPKDYLKISIMIF